MFVASRVESGDEAVVALLPQVIGNIQTTIGGGTLTRTSGVAVQVRIGDPVCQGDVIETAADGRIGIRFIDGTVFNLSADTHVELSEFVCDSNGTSHSALFAVARGTFAFVAGRVAKTGSLWVDTPVGRIRGRAHAGGIGMVSLAALVFSFMKEAQAADRGVTFLDDDNITYKDLPHGVFELVTKEAIPRHIIVEDPGETVVLSKIGSSVSVNPVANTAAQMEELQAAQQEVLANLAKGLGPTGSSPPFSNPQLLLQPINFIQTDTTHGQSSLPPIQSTIFLVPDIFILPPPPPTPPTPPTLLITGIAGQIGVAADNIINVARANAGVEITGSTSGVENGRIVTVTLADPSNHVVYSGTATVTSGTWSINLDPAEAKALADGIYTLTADTTNAAGAPAEASRAIRVDETPPTIAIHTIVGNDVVNVNAASTGFAITGATTDAENGQPVTVKIVDGSGHVVDTFTTTLTNDAWSVNISSTEAKLLHDGSYTVTADVSDSAGNPAPEATQALTVDETPPKVTWLPLAESGIEGATIALGTITTTVNSLPDHSNGVQSLVVSGIPVGAVLTDCANSFMATSGNTSIDVKSWNLSNLKIIPPNDTNFILTVTATDQDVNTASASELVKVDPLAPDLNPVAARGNEDAAIALDLGVTARSLSGTNGDASPNSLDTLVVSDIPVGATLSDGTGLPGHSFTATADNTSHDVASWSLSRLKITPPAEFEGCFTLTIAATERDSEGDISARVTATEVVTVAPVAEPPTASAPATLTLNENACGTVLAGVSVGPLAEDNDDTVSATLRVSHGTLHVGSLSGVTVTGDDCPTLTLSGSAAAVNSLLAGLTYTPTAEYEGYDTLHLSVSSRDGFNTYPTAATASTAIKVNPVADPPTASAPATLTLDENSCGAVLARVSVGPLAEDNDDTVSATLTVSHGTLHVGSLSGVTVTGDDCATLTLSGSAAAVNSLLAGLTYTPTAEYEGCDTLHLSVTSRDGSNTYPTAATASTAITVRDLDEGDRENHGTLAANAAFIEPITNNGTIIVDPNVNHEVTGTFTGIGKFWIDSGATLEFGLGSKVAPGTTDSQMVYFEQGAGKLIIDDWGKFAGVITGTGIGTHLTTSDLIDLTQLPYVGGSMSVSVSYNSATNISTMTFGDGISANNATLHLSGNYTGTAWSFTSINGGAGTEIFDPPRDSGTVTVDGGATPGTLTDTDVGNPPNTFMAVSSPMKSDDSYGTFTMTAAGVWTYTLNDTNYAVRALDADDTLTDTFTVHTIDGTAQVVTITIHGASDDDRHDFGHFATATQIASDPPPVLPQTDSIAGVGSDGQITQTGIAGDTINGTDKADLLHAGSGNDTTNGNDGAGTTRSAFGSDTINANNGNSTVVGGHGPDSPTGGNGNDRFAHLSAADSKTGRSDTFSDSRSGFDRIDLSALGAMGLAVLALSPTSTSVPAHTIAWLYDSADNETIVYVNPTDQTLKIGASGLQEIHLQGIATIQESDFVPEPTVAAVATGGEPIEHGLTAIAANDATVATMTAALVSSGTTGSNGALHASNWTWQKTEESFSFISFDEGRTLATEHTDDGAIIPVGGHSIEPQHGSATASMENSVTFDKAPVHDSAGSLPIGNGAVTPPSGTINNTDITALKTAAEPSHVENGATPEGGGAQPHSDKNITPETSDVATSNNKVHSKDHSLKDHSVSKDHSDLKEHSESIVTNTGPVNAAETHMLRSETAGKLVLGDSFNFKDELPGHKGSDVIDLVPEDHTPASISHRENAAGTHGPPEISETQTIELSLPGHHSVDHFSLFPHHAGGAVVTHVPHDLIV